ncbi:hypothetical protein [Kribbella sp. CA-294648]|uniref:hypothetical protein n=1 Tax=Kribbella sp. CA-294648 TaxID=3239948 RepID=UPI003D8B7EFE
MTNSQSPTAAQLRWQRIARRASDATVLILLVTGVVVSAIDLTIGLDRFAWLAQRIPQITLLGLAFFFASAVLERVTLLEGIRSDLDVLRRDLDDGVTVLNSRMNEVTRVPSEVAAVVRSTRREVPLLPLLGPATSSVLIMGTTLLHFAEQHRELLLEKSRSCSVRILLLDSTPALRQVHFAVGRLFGEEDSFHRELKRSQEAMVTLAKEARGLGGDFEVRGYDIVPTANVIIVDPASPAGQIQVEFLPYRASANLRPGMLLQRQPMTVDAGNLFDFFVRQYDQLWSVSHDVTR